MSTLPSPIRLGVALTGSFCTFRPVLNALRSFDRTEFSLTPILSHAAATTDTRFFTSAAFRLELEDVCGAPILDALTTAEPIGPRKLFDALLVIPATGNTLAKIAAGIADTPVTLAVKSHLRNNRPVILAVSTNDALGANARNIGQLMARKHIYFVPFRQDAPQEKPNSAVADFSRSQAAVRAALQGHQLQPVLLAPLEDTEK